MATQMKYYYIDYPEGEGLTCWYDLAAKVAGIRASGSIDAKNWNVTSSTVVHDNTHKATTDMKEKAAREDKGATFGNSDAGEALAEQEDWCTAGLYQAVEAWEEENGKVTPGDPNEEPQDDDGEDEDESDYSYSSDEEMEDVGEIEDEE